MLSSGGSDMGSPFMLQQKTCQAAFQDLSVQGEINSYLGRFIFLSLFMLLLLLSSLFSTGFSFLFHCSCLVFYPACLSQTFLQVSNGSIITSLPRTALGDFCLGLEKALMLMQHIWTVREHFLTLILTCQSRTTRAADAFKHLWFNRGKTKAVKREIRCWRLHTKPPADPAVGVGLTFWMMPPGEKCNMKKSLCPGKQMTPEATLRLPASGYT